jgi:hypothetical protein
MDEEELAMLVESLEHGRGINCLHAWYDGCLWSFPESASDTISDEWLLNGIRQVSWVDPTEANLDGEL